MARIVGIHEIAQQYKGGNELRAEWLPAVKDGLEAAERETCRMLSLTKTYGRASLAIYFGHAVRWARTFRLTPLRI
jgi:hypothetical protein